MRVSPSCSHKNLALKQHDVKHACTHALPNPPCFLDFFFILTPRVSRWLKKEVLGIFSRAQAACTATCRPRTQRTCETCTDHVFGDTICMAIFFDLTSIMCACNSETVDCYEFSFFQFIFFWFLFRYFFPISSQFWPRLFLPAAVFVSIIYEIDYGACLCLSLIQVHMNRRPIVTGTSVIGITYKGGVMLAADTLGPFEKIELRYFVDFAAAVIPPPPLLLRRFLWFPVTFQGPDTNQSNWQQYSHWGWGRSQ